MKKICKMVYEAPFVEVVPFVENLLHDPVSGVNTGQGDKNDDIIDSPPPGGWLGKEYDFEDMGKDFDWGDY